MGDFLYYNFTIFNSQTSRIIMEFQKDYWERNALKHRRSPTHPVIREYVKPKIKEICKVIDIHPKTSLLDVGAGNGFFSYYFDQICHTVAVDYSNRMNEMNPIKRKWVMDANNLKFFDNQFDIVFCHALLHHVEDLDNVIKEMKRVSRKYVIIIEPNASNPLMYLFSYLVKEENKAMDFTLEYLKKKARKNGLNVLYAFSYGLIVPNKTPNLLLPLFTMFNSKLPFGMVNILILEKES